MMSKRNILHTAGRPSGLSRIFLPALLCCAALVAGLAGLSGCRKQAQDLSHYQPLPNTKNDTLRLFNLLPDSTSIRQSGYVLYVNDTADLFYGRGMGPYNYAACYGVRPWLTVPAQGGTFHLQLTRYRYALDTPSLVHPDAAHLLCETTLTIPPHSGLGNVFFYDDGTGKATIKYMPETTNDPGPPAAGTFKVRVINFAYDLQESQSIYGVVQNSSGTRYPLQLQTADSVPVPGDEQIAFATASKYQQYGYGTFQFRVYNPTTQQYIDNSGVLNDVVGAFDLTTVLNNGSITQPGQYGWNYLFPNYIRNIIGLQTSPTLHVGNIGSYQFSAGGCYTLLVIGDMYAVTLDRQYGPGELDDFAKVQVVNAAPGQSDLQVDISAGGTQTQVAALPFGSYTAPVTVPAGSVTCTFRSHGQTLYTYTTDVPRLGNYLLCYTTNLQKVPVVIPQPVTITPDDYFMYSTYAPAVLQLCKVSCLNLVQDGGNAYLTYNSPLYGDAETDAGTGDLPYKGGANLGAQDGTAPASAYHLRLSSKRADSLANQEVAHLQTPFPVVPTPGTFTLVAAGLLNTRDTAQAIRMIMVRNTNYIPKAQ